MSAKYPNWEIEKHEIKKIENYYKCQLRVAGGIAVCSIFTPFSIGIVDQYINGHNPQYITLLAEVSALGLIISIAYSKYPTHRRSRKIKNLDNIVERLVSR